ncbi:hypothetical protein [Xylanibacter muris]|uniref:DUF642 domain-containing protein n=1 Tax=Xylanibacter muris TaxID=2736290 RepID=A0ABX2ALC1_9BACT|nr:hypothetical protein [Xylanibacter muris]NPD91996.1 hypothetical protein [Xylanibacter muris]
MKKQLLSLSLALLGAVGANAAFTSGSYCYTELNRWQVSGENLITGNLNDGLAALGFKHNDVADLGAGIIDTFEVVTPGDLGMAAIQVNSTGGVGTGGELFLSKYITSPGYYYVTYKVKSGSDGRLTTGDAAAANYQRLFLNNDGTTVCDATEETGNDGVEVSPYTGLRYDAEWKEMKYLVTVSDPCYLNFHFASLVAGDMLADFGVYQVREVGDDRVIDEYISIINAYKADEKNFPNERETLDLLLEFFESTKAELDNPLDPSVLQEADNMISEFLDANTVDVSKYFKNWDFSGGNNGEAKGIKEWKTSDGHTGRWGVVSQLARNVNYGEGKYIATQSYPQGMGDGSEKAHLYQTVSLPPGNYMFTCKASGNYAYRVSSSNKNGVLLRDSVTGMGMFVNNDTLWFDNVSTVSPTKAKRYSMVGTVAEGEDITVGYRTPGFRAKEGGFFAFCPVEIRLLGGATQEDVDAFFFKKTVETAAAALQTSIDNAKAKHADAKYLYGKEELAAAASKGQGIHDEFVTVYSKASEDTINKGKKIVDDAVKVYDRDNEVYVRLGSSINTAETAYADETRTEGKPALLTAINDAKGVYTTRVAASVPTAEDSTAMFTQIDALAAALDVYYSANASYNNPGTVTIVNPDFAEKGNGWNVTNDSEGKQAWKYGSKDGFVNNTCIFANRGNTTGPKNAVLQTVNLKNNGLYELEFQAYSWGQGRHDGIVTEPNGVWFVTKMGDTVDSLMIHTASGTPETYKVRLNITNAPVDVTFGIDALNNADPWANGGEDRSVVCATDYGYSSNTLTFYGAYDKYLQDSIAAVIKPTRDSLQAAVNEAKALNSEARNPNGVDTTPFVNAINEAQGVVDNQNATLDEILAQFPKLFAASNAFKVSGVYPAIGKYFDLTTVIKNPKFNEGDDNFEGWTYGEFTIGETTIASDTLFNNSGTGMLFRYFGGDIHDLANTKAHSKLTQVLADMPAGNYHYFANATYRNVTKGSSYTIESSIVDDYTSEVFWLTMNDEKVAVKGLLQAEGGKVEGTGDNSKYVLPGGESFTNYDYTHTVDVAPLFAKGYYRPSMEFSLAAKGNMELGFLIDGLRMVGQGFFMNPQLRYFGDQNVVDGINDVTTCVENGNVSGSVYSISGTKVGNSLKGLAKGVYIMNGKKYVVN